MAGLGFEAAWRIARRAVLGVRRAARRGSLRQRLFAAFAGAAALGAGSGITGLLYVDRISATLTNTVAVTGPLLEQSIQLLEAGQRFRLAESATGEGPASSAEIVAALHGEMTSRIAALGAVAARAHIDLPLKLVAEREQSLAEFAAEAGAAAQRADDADAEIVERARRIGDLVGDLRATLARLVAPGEDATGRTEGRGSASEAAYDAIVQHAMALEHQIDRISETAQLAAARQVGQPARVGLGYAGDPYEAIDDLVAATAIAVGAGRGEADVATLRQGIAALKPLVADMRAGQAALIDASRLADSARRSLDSAKAAYTGVMGKICQIVRRLEQTSRDNAQQELQQARQIVTNVMLLTMLAGCLFSAMIAHRLTEPLVRLTAQVRRIRRRGLFEPLPAAPSGRKTDEIGTLSRAFNLMIGELADARRRLIEWSEAEIRVQFERLQLAIDSMPQGLCMFDQDDRLIVCNRRYQEMYDLLPDQVRPGTRHETILVSRKAQKSQGAECPVGPQRPAAAFEAGMPLRYVDELENGKSIAICVRPLADGGSVSTHEDVTDRRRSEEQITYLAHHDALTDLPNRVLFRQEMERALLDEDKPDIAVLFLDLDQFKCVNDSLGHSAGDALLTAVAGRLRDCLQPGDRIARLGGDEFAILKVGGDQPVAAIALAERLIAVLTEPFELNDHQVVIGVSIGIALAPSDGLEADPLLKKADMALYRAKSDGRSAYRFFEPEMDAKMQRRRALEMDLRNALARHEFELHYQPLFNLATNAICGCEALIRWRHPKRGLVPPADFVALAEEIGLIGRIGAWALREACCEASRWPSHISVAVNLSPLQFRTGALVLDVVGALAASGLAPGRLELEVTETMLIRDAEATFPILHQLRALGVRISMDDFGTGYSSLGYLRRFPFDKIKIDRSFIHDLPQDRGSIAIVRAMSELCTALGISVAAEGVETEEQLRQLKEERCTEAQGYLLCRPQTSVALSEIFHGEAHPVLLAEIAEATG